MTNILDILAEIEMCDITQYLKRKIIIQQLIACKLHKTAKEDLIKYQKTLASMFPNLTKEIIEVADKQLK